jgi:hypothetical protein
MMFNSGDWLCSFCTALMIHAYFSWVVMVCCAVQHCAATQQLQMWLNDSTLKIKVIM